MDENYCLRNVSLAVHNLVCKIVVVELLEDIFFLENMYSLGKKTLNVDGHNFFDTTIGEM